MFLTIITLVDFMSTVVGAIAGAFAKSISKRTNDLILGFASGVMLSAAVFGLIEPSMTMGGEYGIVVTVCGILVGMLFLKLLDYIVPHLHTLVDGGAEESHPTNTASMNRAILMVLAVAIHNFPEGAAVGVSFGTGNMSDVIAIATGIALQNIPEGIAVIAPLTNYGISRGRAFVLACFTAVVEALGVAFGYLASRIATAMLPAALAFAGGAMLYVISDEMIPQTHLSGNESGATEMLIVGFCVMLLLDFFL